MLLPPFPLFSRANRCTARSSAVMPGSPSPILLSTSPPTLLLRCISGNNCRLRISSPALLEAPGRCSTSLYFPPAAALFAEAWLTLRHDDGWWWRRNASCIVFFFSRSHFTAAELFLSFWRDAKAAGSADGVEAVRAATLLQRAVGTKAAPYIWSNTHGYVSIYRTREAQHQHDLTSIRNASVQFDWFATLMAPRIDDRWVWLGFGVFLFFAVRQLRNSIQETVLLTEIDPAQYEDREERDKKSPEDSISVETLKILADSPNPNIANSAISLIVTRFASAKSASEMLAQDAYSSDPKLRSQARTAIAFLKDWPLPPGSDRDPTLDMPWTPDRPSRGYGLRDDADEDDFAGIEWMPETLPELIDSGMVDGGAVRRTGMEVVGGLHSRPRMLAEDDEVERRRRRREAMVLHEGGGRVVEDDIIRPR
ncbi:hypothetical protein KC323_g266 [Hortaea werneckii]|nr:hypothetical protein KC323_g266 [Hortaea werneckii]